MDKCLFFTIFALMPLNASHFAVAHLFEIFWYRELPCAMPPSSLLFCFFKNEFIRRFACSNAMLRYKSIVHDALAASKRIEQSCLRRNNRAAALSVTWHVGLSVKLEIARRGFSAQGVTLRAAFPSGTVLFALELKFQV